MNFRHITEMENHGVNRTDINKLMEAGYCTVESVRGGLTCYCSFGTHGPSLTHTHIHIHLPTPARRPLDRSRTRRCGS